MYDIVKGELIAKYEPVQVMTCEDLRRPTREELAAMMPKKIPIF